MTHAPSFRDLTALLKAAFALFGDPAALAEERMIERRQAATIQTCLRLLEGLARALLVVLALALPRPESRGAQPPRPGRPEASPGRARGASAADGRPAREIAAAEMDNDLVTDESASSPSAESALSTTPALFENLLAGDDLPPASERWPGVSFRLLPPERPSGSGGGCGAPSRWVPTRALALRFEALCRVAEHPERYARRLARLISSGELDARSDLAARLLRPPPPGEDALGARETSTMGRTTAWLALERADLEHRLAAPCARSP